MPEARHLNLEIALLKLIPPTLNPLTTQTPVSPLQTTTLAQPLKPHFSETERHSRPKDVTGQGLAAEGQGGSEEEIG